MTGAAAAGAAALRLRKRPRLLRNTITVRNRPSPGPTSSSVSTRASLTPRAVATSDRARGETSSLHYLGGQAARVPVEHQPPVAVLAPIKGPAAGHA